MSNFSYATKSAMIGKLHHDLIEKKNYIKEASKAVQEDVLREAPEGVRMLYNDSSTRKLLAKKVVSLGAYLGSASIYGLSTTRYMPSPPVAQRLKEISDSQKEWCNEVDKITRQARIILDKCETYQQVQELCPLLVKYIPETGKPSVKHVDESTRMASKQLNHKLLNLLNEES